MEIQNNHKVLLIGGCGYIGSSLFLFLKKKNIYVDTVDLEWFGNFVNPKNIKIDYVKLSKKFLDKYSCIILLAGHSSIPMSQVNYKETFNNNVGKFISFLSKIDKQKLIYASSSSVYGNTKNNIVNEEYDRYTPTNYYDLSKKEIDYYSQLSDKNYYGLRFGTVCGGSLNLRVDVMINKMFNDAVKYKKITIFNKDFLRPILGINDLNRVVYALIKSKKNKPGIYNIASFNLSIYEMAQKVKEYIKAAEIEVVGKNYDYYNFSVDTSKFANEFNFSYKENIDTIIKSLLKTYKKTNKTLREKKP